MRRAGGALSVPLSVAVVAVLGMVFSRVRAKIIGETLADGANEDSRGAFFARKMIDTH